MANLLVAYVLWFFGGVFGWHHFYLGRDMQGALWLVTYGMFGLGWMRDVWRLPDYVDLANRDTFFVERKKLSIKQKPKGPSISLGLVIGQFICGHTFAYFGSQLFTFLIPEDPAELDIFVHEQESLYNGLMLYESLTYVFWMALGVWYVGQIAELSTGNYWHALVGGMAAILAQSFLGGDFIAVGAIISSQFFREWNTEALNTPKPSTTPSTSVCVRTCKRASKILPMIFVCYLIAGAHFYHHAEVTDSNTGEVFKLKVCFINVIKSPAFQHFKIVMWQVWTEGQEKGWQRAWGDFVAQLDLNGKDNAYRVLGLDKDVEYSLAEIKRARNKLALQLHPDKLPANATPEEKLEQEARFVEMQEAYQRLTELASRSSSNSGNESDGRGGDTGARNAKRARGKDEL